MASFIARVDFIMFPHFTFKMDLWTGEILDSESNIEQNYINYKLI